MSTDYRAISHRQAVLFSESNYVGCIQVYCTIRYDIVYCIRVEIHTAEFASSWSSVLL